MVEFNWIGRRVIVESDSDFLTTQIGRLWGNTISLKPDEGAPPLVYKLQLSDSDGPLYTSPVRSCRLDRQNPEIQAYNLMIADLFGQVNCHFVLHATTVCKNGQALVVSGPSTFGKTTLGIQLACRGFDLLADDVTLVDRSNGSILPFNRPFRLRPGSRDMLNPEQLERAKNATEITLEQEWAVKPDGWIKPAQQPCPAALVVVIRPREDGSGLRRFPYLDLRVIHQQRSLLKEVGGIEGVTEVTLDEKDECRAVVEIDSSIQLRRWLELHRDSIVHAIKLPAGQAAFDEDPEMERISVFQAAVELCQEMQNRHEGSLLAEEYGGDELSLVSDLAGTIRYARCFALSPGRLETTLKLLEERFQEAVSERFE